MACPSLLFSPRCEPSPHSGVESDHRVGGHPEVLIQDIPPSPLGSWHLSWGRAGCGGQAHRGRKHKRVLMGTEPRKRQRAERKGARRGGGGPEGGSGRL